MNIKWTKDQERYLQENYLQLTNKQLAESLSKSISSVMNKLTSMNLTRALEYTGDLEGEKWRKWSELYLVSNHGRVFSVSYEKLIKTEINNKGYECFNEYFADEGKRKSMVHILVAKLFVKKPQSDEKLEVNHKDGNKLNNRHGNLEWITHRKNLEHAVGTGLHANFKHGENNPLSKYSDDLVRRVCVMIKDGHSDQTIATNLSLRKDYVYRIRIKKRSRKISDLYF